MRFAVVNELHGINPVQRGRQIARIVRKEEKLQVFHSPLFERIEKSAKEKNNE